MFTGIVEEIGTVKSIRENSLGLDIEITASKIFEDLNIGDSIAVNGCCQTVTNISENTFTVQAVYETVKLTNFKNLKENANVNLERAMLVNSRFGGHIVTGHIDGVGKILSIKNIGNSTIFEISVPDNIMKYLIYKGSVTLNGTSLTISELNNNSIKVSVIPHTLNNTIFNNAKIGDEINVEPDILAKYVEKLMIKEDNKSSHITMEFLKENGF